MWHVQFDSHDFAPYLPESCQTNPGVYGFELALWLSQELAKQGVITSYPRAEDWGWYLRLKRDTTQFLIGCASITHAGEGYRGGSISWRIFVDPQLSIFQRRRRETFASEAERLATEISAAFTAKAIVLSPFGSSLATASRSPQR